MLATTILVAVQTSRRFPGPDDLSRGQHRRWLPGHPDLRGKSDRSKNGDACISLAAFTPDIAAESNPREMVFYEHVLDLYLPVHRAESVMI
jgi:hypothetical protein